MPRRSRVLLVILILAFGWSIEASAQDIINPVPGYRQLRRDTVKTCEVFFEPLPRFGDTSHILFTYYSQFYSEAGLEIAMKSETSTSIDLNPYVVTIPGPIAKGDTIQCRFQIVPRAVGYIDLSFVVCDTISRPVLRPLRVHTKMLLSPSGETIALATPACSSIFGPLMGPNPELLNKGVRFAIDPKLPPELQPPNYEEYLSNRPERYWYDVRLEVAPGIVTGSIVIHGTLSPYQSFNAGIGIDVRSSDNQEVTKLSPSIEGPAIKGAVYDFEIEVKANCQSELGLLTIGFTTPNPDFGSQDGVLSKLNWEQLNRHINLCTGFDESGNLSFVTDKNVWVLLESREKEGIKPKFVDERLELVRTHKRPRTQGDVIYSENYDKIMNTYKAER